MGVFDNYECSGQLSLFATKAKLIRKNEYEVYHCTNCGCLVPCRILIGDWPKQETYCIRYCPNCGAEFENPYGVNDEDILKKDWKYIRLEENKKPVIKNPCRIYSDTSCNRENLTWIARDLGMKCESECCYGCTEKNECGAACNQRNGK